MIGQPRRHGGRAGPPLRGRARAVGGHRLRQGLAYARMREAKIIVDMIQGELLPHAVLTLAEGGHPSPDRGHMLAHRQVEAVTVDGGIAPSTSASKPCVPLLRHTAPQ